MISVLIPTYGRPELLEEAIECFLQQTVIESELVILNDRSDQTLVYEHPRVRIINLPDRIATLGDKRNELVKYAKGNYVTQWDDDDIYLPNHLETVMARMPLYYKSRLARQCLQWVDNGHRLYRIMPAKDMHTIIMETTLFHETGGYAPRMVDEDSAYLKRLLTRKELCGPPFKHEPPTFILRRATGRQNITLINRSLFVPDKGWDGLNHQKSWDAMREEVDKQAKVGVLTLTPRWDQDYVAKAKASWEAFSNHGQLDGNVQRNYNQAVRLG
jgi:glycosyltransferase involved in cell wall biosynthesis